MDMENMTLQTHLIFKKRKPGDRFIVSWFTFLSIV